MAFWEHGAFNFAAVAVKYVCGFARSADGMIIEPANAFVDGGDHLNAIDSTHCYGHKGAKFFCEQNIASLANAGTTTILLLVGATHQAHLEWSPMVQSSGDATVSLTEGITYTLPGTALTEFNVARGIATGDNSSTITASHTPTGVAGGTLLSTIFIPGGTGPRSAGGSGGGGRAEIILKANTAYLVTVTNISGSNQRVHAHLDWYDHLPITSKFQV